MGYEDYANQVDTPEVRERIKDKASFDKYLEIEKNPQNHLDEIADHLKKYPDSPYYKGIAESAIPQMPKKIAAGFRDPGYQKDMYGNYRTNVLNDLVQDSKSTGMSMNRRGLGQGGIAQGAQARLAQRASGYLAQGKQDIADQSEAKAQEVETNALNYGIQQRNLKQQMQNTIFNGALESYRKTKAGNAAIGKGIGAVGGGLLAGYYSGGNPYATAGGAAAGGALGGAVGGASS